MNSRHKLSAGASLLLSLMMVATAVPTFAKSAAHDGSYAVTADNANSASAATNDASADANARQDTAAPSRQHMQTEHRHSSGKRRGVIIGGTALTGMLVGAHVAGPIGALAGAGVGAGVGMFLAHIL